MYAWLDAHLIALADLLGTDTLVLNPLLAVVLVSLTCGLVGSTVVSSRMAFFSDAMAHTAFAGVATAVLTIIILADVRSTKEADAYLWLIQPVMVGVGVAVGAAIVFVRERSGLSNDTVIGVFFAGAIGVGAMVLPAARNRVNIDVDTILFGSVTLARAADLVPLALLLVLTAAAVGWRFNALALASFNPSLARSRGVGVRLNNYLFVVLLAVVVNVAIKSVGVLLINALLVVPAAAAANVGGNLRQVFWLTLAGTVAAGVAGQQLSAQLEVPLGGVPIHLGPSGTIVVVAVGWFAVSLAVAAARGRLRGAGPADRAS